MQRQFRYYGTPAEDYTNVSKVRSSFTIFIFYEIILLKLCYGNGDTDRRGSQACTFDIKTPGPSLRLITLNNGERNGKSTFLPIIQINLLIYCINIERRGLFVIVNYITGNKRLRVKNNLYMYIHILKYKGKHFI